MTKIIAILFIMGCFFFKDAAVLFFSQEHFVYFAEDAPKSESSENTEKDGEEKNDEYKIGLKIDQFIYNTGVKNKFYPTHELNYFQHFLEINSPPPDFI